jgi:hypothetical protein
VYLLELGMEQECSERVAASQGNKKAASANSLSSAVKKDIKKCQ